MRSSRLTALAAVICLLAMAPALADGVAPFDLVGPDLQVTVTRGHETLPIAAVPNLAAGDRLWIRADLPPTQSRHYLLIVGFLRGATNPPPRDWFRACETWKRRCARQGLELAVPQGAEQVLVFLAPQTSGDFRTLVGAVQGRPGAFVRTSQDLNQATLDSSRLDAYLRAIHALDESAPEKLQEAAPLLGRSLAIKVNQSCLERIPELQAPCLMQGQDSLILNDGHSTSIVEALTSGPATDLAMEASYTPQLSYGYYSPYIASVLDIARIFGSFTTASYQYIPALATLRGETLALALNTPPSFHDPLSVLVIALPAVEAPQPPPLHAVDPSEIYCARKSSLVLPVEGAPLVFSTGYARSMRLSLTGSDGRTIDLPASADAEQGGFVVDTSGIGTASLGNVVHGSLRGYWGFEPFDGPGFQLVNASSDAWRLAPDEGVAIVGRQDTIHLEASSVSCIDRIMLRDPAGKELEAQWKTVAPHEVAVTLPLQQAQPGPLTLLVRQFGAKAAQPVALQAFSEAAHLDGFTLHAGDSQGVLTGSRLDEVAGLALGGVAFTPGALATSQGVDQLTLTAQDPQAAAALQPGQTALAKVRLKDGRVLDLEGVIADPRPSVILIGKSVQPSPSSRGSHIQLANGDELPHRALLTFSVRAKSPAAFDNDEMIEVATGDGSYSTTLSEANGGITLENRHVAIITLDPSKSFGPSAFGPLEFRVIDQGVTGDWQPLATLVRLPRLRELVCPATPELACKLSGADLFLVDAISTEPNFAHAVQVPDGFPGYALPVPHPNGGELYVRLRDDPSVINLASLEARQLPPTPQEEARASARQAAASPPTAAATAPADATQPPARELPQPSGEQATVGAASPPPKSNAASQPAPASAPARQPTAVAKPDVTASPTPAPPNTT